MAVIATVTWANGAADFDTNMPLGLISDEVAIDEEGEDDITDDQSTETSAAAPDQDEPAEQIVGNAYGEEDARIYVEDLAAVENPDADYLSTVLDAIWANVDTGSKSAMNNFDFVFNSSPMVISSAPIKVETSAGEIFRGKVISSDQEGDILNYSVSLDALQGTVKINTDGSFEYEADSNLVGLDNFTVKVEDNKGGVTTQTILVSNIGEADDSVTSGGPGRNSIPETGEQEILFE